MFSINDPHRHFGCRINDRITWKGYRALLLQNELLQIVVLVDKGSEIVQFLHKPTDTDFLWHAPNELREEAHFVPAGGDQTSSFFDRWSGGWFEVLPNGGPGSMYKGAQLGFFAETINVPWEYRILTDTPDEVSVGLWFKTYRTPFLLQKTLTLKKNTPALFIEERVTNLGTESVAFMWGHHPVVGEPFLDEHCRISAPPCKVEIFHDEDGPDHRMGLFQKADWPTVFARDGGLMDLRIVPPKSGKTMDNCYLMEFEEGWISVQNTRRAVGFGLAWDPTVFRYVWMWQAIGGGLGAPWYGRTNGIGIEPWTSYPCAGLETAVENGTARSLEPGGSLQAWLTAVAFTGLDDVSRITRDGQVT